MSLEEMWREVSFVREASLCSSATYALGCYMAGTLDHLMKAELGIAGKEVAHCTHKCISSTLWMKGLGSTCGQQLQIIPLH